ncbi:MAG TPA: hypothetical protein VN750_06290 [Steroidobacteraceae bacterium]|nr:hypothetical protein [Steroidobacteraceae bacterium]
MSQVSLVTHLRALSLSAKTLGLQVQLQPDTLRVEVCGVDRYVELEPEFAAVSALGLFECSSEALPRYTFFAGWRCAPKKYRDASIDKRAFAAFCARHGVRTPRSYANASEANTNILVKRIQPTERGVIRGPFTPGFIPADCLQPLNDVMLQEFVPGHLLEAWYWDGQLFAVETRNRPFITGDGESSARDLITCSGWSPEHVDWTAAEDALRFQGATLDTVLPAGKELAVELRFHSTLQQPGPDNEIETVKGTPVHEQLQQVGPLFCNAIPPGIRAHTQFVLSGIIDPQRRVWFTDMVTDRRIHTDVYDPMLRSLFGKPMLAAKAAESPAPVQPAPLPAPPQRHVVRGLRRP